MSGAPMRLLGRETLHEGHWTLSRVRFERVRRDGTPETLEREVFSRPDAATILLFDPARDMVVLTRQFRLPALLNGGRESLIEACAGLIEEEAEACARREALEETGIAPQSVERLFEAYSSPGGLTERLVFFIGRYGPGDRIDAGGGLAHEGEDIEVLELPFETAYAMIASGEIIDAKTIVLLQHLKIERLERALARLTPPA